MCVCMLRQSGGGGGGGGTDLLYSCYIPVVSDHAMV